MLEFMNLFIVATPIGNLHDITERGREVLCSVPVVFAEDTRVTTKLLQHIGSKAKLIAYHQHTDSRRLSELLDYLETGDVAVVTDAGTPGVSDPGGQLVAAVYARYADECAIVPIPGPSAVMAAASIAGFPMDEFVFLAYPPHKKGRKTFFDQVASTKSAVIFFESVHRITKAMDELVSRDPDRGIVVCRELTKKFETIERGTTREVRDKINKSAQKGEFVIVLAPSSHKRPELK